jgi:hypothetical protein
VNVRRDGDRLLQLLIFNESKKTLSIILRENSYFGYKENRFQY